MAESDLSAVTTTSESEPTDTNTTTTTTTTSKRSKNPIHSYGSGVDNWCSCLCWYTFTSCWLYPAGWVESLVRWLYHFIFTGIWLFFSCLCCCKVKCTRRIRKKHWKLVRFFCCNIGCWCCNVDDDDWPEGYGENFCCSFWGLCCLCACGSNAAQKICRATWERCCPCPSTNIYFPNTNATDDSGSCDCCSEDCCCGGGNTNNYNNNACLISAGDDDCGGCDCGSCDCGGCDCGSCDCGSCDCDCGSCDC